MSGAESSSPVSPIGGGSKWSPQKLGTPMQQPSGIRLSNWSRESGKVRSFGQGNYKKHDYADRSLVSPSGPLSVVAFAHQGGFVCLFCRRDDYPVDAPEWPEVVGRADAVFFTPDSLDKHALAYHYPYVRGGCAQLIRSSSP